MKPSKENNIYCTGKMSGHNNKSGASSRNIIHLKYDNVNMEMSKQNINYRTSKMKTAIGRDIITSIYKLANISLNNQLKRDRQRNRRTRIENAKIMKASPDEMAKALYYLNNEMKNPGGIIPHHANAIWMISRNKL